MATVLRITSDQIIKKSKITQILKFKITDFLIIVKRLNQIKYYNREVFSQFFLQLLEFQRMLVVMAPYICMSGVLLFFL